MKLLLATTTSLALAGPALAEGADTGDIFGQFQDIFGQVRRQFTVKIKGDWNGTTLKLVEDFVYEDGSTEQRVWTLHKTGATTWEGTAPGVIGVATRNHYTEADWNPSNRWLVREVTGGRGFVTTCISYEQPGVDDVALGARLETLVHGGSLLEGNTEFLRHGDKRPQLSQVGNPLHNEPGSS